MWSGPAQHLHGDDARLGEPRRLRGQRRAAVRALPRAHRARPSRCATKSSPPATPTGAASSHALLGPAPGDAPVWYQKHMTHHLLPHIDHGWIAQLRNVLLIRDPREVVASYIKSRATVTAEDIGLPQQVALYDELSAAGAAPPVIDAGDFLRAPEAAPARAVRLAGHRLQRSHAALAARARAPATASGRRTGTRMSGNRPASKRRSRMRWRFRQRRPSLPRLAGRITNGCMRCAWPLRIESTRPSHGPALR